MTQRATEARQPVGGADHLVAVDPDDLRRAGRGGGSRPAVLGDHHRGALPLPERHRDASHHDLLALRARGRLADAPRSDRRRRVRSLVLLPADQEDQERQDPHRTERDHVLQVQIDELHGFSSFSQGDFLRNPIT